MSRTVNYSDAYELITRKILINKMSKELLKTQIEFSTASKILQDNSIDTATKKIKLVDDLNDLFEQQLSEFDANRQDKCINIYLQLHQIDTLSDDMKKLHDKLATLDNKMRDLSCKIDHYESSMPNEQLVTNFKVTSKNQN